MEVGSMVNKGATLWTYSVNNGSTPVPLPPLGYQRPSPTFAAMATERLFDAFPPAVREQWEAVITKELKGKAPSTLNVELEGMSIPPFQMAVVDPNKERRRGVKRTGNTWRAGVELGPWQENANDLLQIGRAHV